MSEYAVKKNVNDNCFYFFVVFYFCSCYFTRPSDIIRKVLLAHPSPSSLLIAGARDAHGTGAYRLYKATRKNPSKAIVRGTKLHEIRIFGPISDLSY